jgi:predicted phage tail protein
LRSRFSGHTLKRRLNLLHPAKELKMLILVIIGCTVLIIVCLGGGKKLGQIILGAAAIVGAIVVLGANGAKDIQPPQMTIFWVIVAVGAFFLLMFLRSRGVNWKIAHMAAPRPGPTVPIARDGSRSN